jgi:hypothetical protein
MLALRPIRTSCASGGAPLNTLGTIKRMTAGGRFLTRITNKTRLGFG